MSDNENRKAGQHQGTPAGQAGSMAAEGHTQGLSRAELFIERNRRLFIYTLIGILVLVTGYVLYRSYVVQPREAEAQRQLFPAAQRFAKGEFQQALEGDGNTLGFNQIISDYGSTKGGNLARYYAAICLRELGNYEEAIAQLKSFSAHDKMLAPMKHGLLGDCYLELERKEDALAEYTKATSYRENEVSAPMYLMKRGMLEELMGRWQDALESYRSVKENYPQSMEARSVEKDIARVAQRTK